MPEPTGVVSIAAPNYAAHVRVLARSLRGFHPDVPLCVVLVSPRACPAPFADPPVRWLTLADLCTPAERRRLLLRYGPKGLCAALKPRALRWILDSGHRSALFLDPDMLVRASLDDCLEVVQRYALTLTPHLTPSQLGRADPALERELVMVGTFNGGFIGVSDRPEVRRFLDWWDNRLQTHCLEDPAGGIHYDQRWLDLAPGFVPDFRVLSDAGINFGHWRLPALRVERRDGDLAVEGRPLRLMHFSGYDPSRPDELTRFRPGLRVHELGLPAELFFDYAALLLEARWDQWQQVGWELPRGLRLARRVQRALRWARAGAALLMRATGRRVRTPRRSQR